MEKGDNVLADQMKQLSQISIDQFSISKLLQNIPYHRDEQDNEEDS